MNHLKSLIVSGAPFHCSWGGYWSSIPGSWHDDRQMFNCVLEATLGDEKVTEAEAFQLQEAGLLPAEAIPPLPPYVGD